MDPELKELYQQVILDHHRQPRNYGRIENAEHRALGHNPLCGDKIHMEFVLDESGKISDVGFTGEGCAICTASSSMMTDAIRGKTKEEANALFEAFHSLLTGTEESGGADLGKLAVFAGVREFPVRVKCATLPWHTFQAAMNNNESISTE